MSLAVVHLARAKNGGDPFEAFADTYAANPAWVPHLRVLLLKGYVPGSLEARLLEARWRALGDPGSARVLVVPDAGYDLGSYALACGLLREEHVLLTNSFSRPLRPGWARAIHAAAAEPGVGLAGATGSLEVDPHVRTNAFCAPRRLLLDALGGRDPLLLDRWGACALEAGPGSLTRIVRRAGLRAVVVSAEGAVRDVEDARDLRVFRWGRQENLLVADNRTDGYERADAAERASLQRLAWGAVEP